MGEEERSPDLHAVPEGRYQEFERLGRGGMGVVFVALDTELERRVAFKIVRPPHDETGTDDPLRVTGPSGDTPDSRRYADLTARFLQEAWVTGALEHPGIVPVYELGQTPRGVPYYTMRLVRGERTLADAIREFTSMDERLALLEPFLKLCDAIRFAHSRGVIHRDLKPENVMLGDFGEVVVIDWGLAKTRDRPDLAADLLQQRIREHRKSTSLETAVGSLGTPGYMAPEATEGRMDEVDERSDVFSLGAVLHEILTGQRPSISACEEIEAGPELPAELARICACALARSPDDRHGGVDELAAEIREWQRQSAVEREAAELARRLEELHVEGRNLQGDERIAHLDQVVVLASRILERLPDHSRTSRILASTEIAREKAIRGAERAALVRTLRRAAVVLAIGGLAVWAVVRGIAVVPPWLEERSAEREYGASLDLPAREAIPRLEALLRDFPRTEAVKGASNRLGDLYLTGARYREAQEAWIRAFAEDPDGAEGIDAQLDLARLLADQGRQHEAMQPLVRLQSKSLPPGLDARHRLLSAEILLARNDHPRAVAFLDSLEGRDGDLGASAAARRRALGRIVDELLPTRRLEREHPGNSEQIVFGRFRPGPPGALVVSRGRALLLGSGPGGTSCEVLVLPDRGSVAGLHAADLDGDGRDELIVACNSGGTDFETPTSLAIYRLDGAEPRCLRTFDIPHATYAIDSGDLDGDGDVDLVLGGSYPWRGVRVLRCEGPFEYEESDPGDLAEISDAPSSDVPEVDVADLDGDGRPELVVSTMAFRHFALLVFSSRGDTFERRASLTAGYVDGATVVDLDRDGKPQIIFALSSHFYRACLSRYREFLPQGVHSATLRGGKLEVRPIVTRGRLSDRPLDVPPPVSYAFQLHGFGDLDGVGPVALLRSTTSKGVFRLGGQAQLVTLATEEPMLLPLTGLDAGAVAMGQLDDDPGPEIVVLRRDAIVLYGLEGERPAGVSADWPREIGPSPTGGPVVNEVGQTLAAMGLHAQALERYRASWAEHRGTGAGRIAIEGIISSLARLGDAEGCFDALDEYAATFPRDRFRQAALLARYRLRFWDVDGSLEIFGWLADFGHHLELEHDLAVRRGRQLAGWRRTRDVVLPDRLDWLITDPGRCRLHDDGRLEFVDGFGSRTRAFVPVAWSGGSIQIRCDARLRELENSHSAIAGLCRRGPAGPRHPDGFHGVFANTSAHPSGCSLRWRPSKGPPRQTGTGTDHPLETWLQPWISYAAEIDRAGVVVRARDSGKVHSVSNMEGLTGEWSTPLDLAFGLAGENRRARAHVDFANILIRVPEGSTFEFRTIEESPETDWFRANAALARGRRDVAIGLYEKAVAAAPVAAWRDLAALTVAVLRWQENGKTAALKAMASRLGGVSGVDRLLRGRPLLMPPDDLERLLHALEDS